MEGVLASGESVSTSAHASSKAEVVATSDACLPDSVGYTRRLDRSPHFAHWTWSMYGGAGTSADAIGASAKGMVMAANATARRRRTPLTGLALNLENLGPHVDEIDTCGHSGDRHAGDAEDECQEHADAEDHQPDGFRQLVGGGVGVGPLQGGVHERVNRRHHHRNLQNSEDVTH